MKYRGHYWGATDHFDEKVLNMAYTAASDDGWLP